jgi:hypothetical protein
MLSLPFQIAVLFSAPQHSVPSQATRFAPAELELASSRLVDLDGDGDLDVLAVRVDGTLLVRRNEGARAFLDLDQELPRVSVTSVLCSDLDADGVPDLYLVSPGSDVALLGQGGGRFREATDELGLTESGAGVAAERVDVDADGLPDLVVRGERSDLLFWARADGRFERGNGTTDGTTEGDATAPPQSGVRPGGPIAAPAAHAPTGPAGAPPDRSGLAAAASPPSTTGSQAGLGFAALFVNDEAGEVGSADIPDGSLTGADVSTSSGNVTFGGGATVTALKAVFGSSTAASGTYAAVLGGKSNSASGLRSVIGGGLSNTTVGIDATVAGGGHNHASNNWATVAGGRYNVASGVYAAVSGGLSNTASSFKAMVPGGLLCTAAGSYSFAAGRRAKANHNGSFVWGDSVNVDKASAATDQFNVFAEGGARIFAVGQTTPSMVVDSAGNVGIGTATPGFTLEVNGSAHRVDNSSTWTVTSDARLKKNVADIEGALETLLSLRGVTFEYRDPAAPGLRRGFVAQEVERVLPEWVDVGPDGYRRLTLGGFEALAVEAFREQQRELEAQREELDALRAEVDRLRATEPAGLRER